MKHNTFEKYDAFTVGEVFDIHEGELARFIGENGHFSTMFDFSAHMLSNGAHGWYDAAPITFARYRKAVFDSQLEVQNIGFEAIIIENHDEPRGVSRFLPDYAQNAAGAKMLGTVNLLLRGIPFIYQGQEIGMRMSLSTALMTTTISIPSTSIIWQKKPVFAMKKLWQSVRR